MLEGETTLLWGEMLLDRLHEIDKGNLRGWDVLIWIVKRMKVPSDEGVISAEDPTAFIDERIGFLARVFIVEDVNEHLWDQEDSNFDDRIIQNAYIVGSDELELVANFLDVSGKFDGTYAIH